MEIENEKLEPPTMKIADDGTVKMSLAATNLLIIKDGYTFLTLEEVKKLGIDYVVCYYVKEGDNSQSPCVYSINYLRKKDGVLIQVSKPNKLPPKESAKQYNEFIALRDKKL